MALKLLRAKHHFNALGEVCQKAIEQSAGDPFVEREGDWEVVRVGIRKFPLWPSIVSGDYVHNLRAALDHLVWQLVKVSDAKPGPWNSFPIYGDKDNFVRNVKQRANWNPEAVLIEQKNRESWEPLEDGAELARFRFRPGVEPNVRVTGPIFLEAGFEAEFSETEGFTILLGRMQTIGEGVEKIVESFWDFFPEQPPMG